MLRREEKWASPRGTPPLLTDEPRGLGSLRLFRNLRSPLPSIRTGQRSRGGFFYGFESSLERWSLCPLSGGTPPPKNTRLPGAGMGVGGRERFLQESWTAPQHWPLAGDTTLGAV